jgi:hypothetical protein
MLAEPFRRTDRRNRRSRVHIADSVVETERSRDRGYVMTASKWDCITQQQYYEERNEDPSDAQKRPTPWWMLAHEKPPEPPRRLTRRSTSRQPRRKLVRVGKSREA